MNDDQLKQLKDAFAQNRLTEAEKASMRADLAHFMDAHPISSAPVRFGAQRSSWLYVSHVLLQNRVPVALALLLVVGGSTAAAAQGTLPGDLLYPIKVHVNENVETALALSTEARAETEARIAVRRLDEVKQLSDSGKLDAKVNAQLKEQFSARADALDKQLAKLNQKGDATVSAKVNGSIEKKLEARFDALVVIGANATTTATTSRPLVSGILGSIFTRHETATDTRAKGQVKKPKASSRGEATTTTEIRSSGKKTETRATTTTEVRRQTEERGHASTTSPTSTSTGSHEEGSGILKRIESIFKGSISETGADVQTTAGVAVQPAAPVVAQVLAPVVPASGGASGSSAGGLNLGL